MITTIQRRVLIVGTLTIRLITILLISQVPRTMEEPMLIKAIHIRT